MSPDYKALCAELLQLEQEQLYDRTPPVEYTDWKRRYDAAIARVRAALAQPEPQGPTAIGPEWQPCVKLPITVHVREQRPGETHSSTREGITPLHPDDLIMRGVQGEEYPIGRELFNQTYRMGAALAQPEPVAPTNKDLDALERKHWKLSSVVEYDSSEGFSEAFPKEETFDHRAYARAVLARWGTPTIQPVPVSERLPGPEDCDAEGRCWWWHPDHKEDDFDDGWILLNPKWADGRRDSDDSLIYTHWLPANALPTPEATNA